MSSFRTHVAVLVSLLALAGLVGCGDSDSDSGSDSATNAAQPSSSAPAGVQRAADAIKPYLEPPSEIGVSAPLSRTPRGARIVFMECATPACKLLGDGLASAAKALGATLDRVNAGQTPQSTARAWSEVIANPPKAVIQGAFPPSLEMQQLRTMKSKGIPVVTAYADEAPGLTTSVVGKPQFEATGKAMANYVIAESEGKAKAVVITNGDIPGLIPQLQHIKDTFSANCPACEVEGLTVPLNGIGRTVPGQIASYLQRNRDTDWIIFNTPDFIAGVPQALSAASITGVKAITQSESPIALNYLKGNQLLSANYAISLEFAAWRMVDTAARLIVGDEAPKSSPMPAQFLLAKDLTFDINKSWPAVPGYKQKFTELWGS